YDYGSSAGVVIMSRHTYEAAWNDRKISGVALEAAPGVDVTALVAAVRERAAGGPRLVIRSNRALREASMEIFDRTFAITGVLRVALAVVAALGVVVFALWPSVSRPRIDATVAVREALASDDAGFARALAPRSFSFPADHGPHPDFRTEWWYYTGNLKTAAGR